MEEEADGGDEGDGGVGQDGVGREGDVVDVVGERAEDGLRDGPLLARNGHLAPLGARHLHRHLRAIVQTWPASHNYFFKNK